MTVVVVVTCNHCSNSLELPFEPLLTMEQIISTTVIQGWISHKNNVQFCPDCSNQEKELILAEKYSESKLALAKYRLWVIAPLLEIDNRSERKPAVIRRAEEVRDMLANGDTPIQKAGYKEHLSVSEASIYRWLNAYGKAEELEALVPLTHKRGHRETRRLQSEQERIMQTIIEACVSTPGEKQKLDDIWIKLIAEIERYNQGVDLAEWITVPSRATLARRIKAFKQSSP